MTTKQMLYLIGQPGAGKTTLLRACLDGVVGAAESVPFAHILYARGVQLGKDRAGFAGTDALALNVQPKALDWLGRTHQTTIIAEGDRLANDRFFTAVQELGWHLTVAHLCTDDDEAERRRAARGSHQAPTWLRGRQTKVSRLAAQWCQPQWTLDGGLPVASLRRQLCTHPVLQRIRGEETP